MTNDTVGHPASPKTKIVGIGLNKTGTKTLGHYLARWGYRNRSYDSNTTRESPAFRLYEAGDIDALMAIVEQHDSFEDWPWPLLYEEIDARFDDVKFVLTTRASSDTWFRSLCNMAVRIGPMPLFEKTVYGFARPHGHKSEFVTRYEAHNASVRAYFEHRPDDLLELCWENGDNAETLAQFVGVNGVDTSPLHSNRSPATVYSGNSRFRATLARWHYLWLGAPHSLGRRIRDAVARRIGRAG
ncbi:MAG: sulfotransferase [Pseudomonadota bacterium]